MVVVRTNTIPNVGQLTTSFRIFPPCSTVLYVRPAASHRVSGIQETAQSLRNKIIIAKSNNNN